MSLAGLKIRKAKLEDVKAIVTVHVETWKKSYKAFVSDEILQERIVSNERIEKMKVPVSKGLVWVAELNNEIVGFAGLKEKISDKEAEIAVFYVLPVYQGRGIGKALFDCIFEDLKEKQCKKLLIWTMEKAPSVLFYKKMGGVLTGETKKWHYDITIVELVWSVK